ncbi:translocase of outer mitochondrial membrane [Puccinia graminis f. sp. tritici]|uniref:Translocase of outer membrane 40 kDa subunit n=1 Tax=Puccinia graminis f. sp. tritici TaxID=56615 RepID=A0A5B0PS71_PUCGR|nr:translocase of outer mitochondrial membrane [Puccinia graminis f. sp. tritici]KAA1103766.1 translocase of outer mitochondrial membrane [Puccinia graminis f. sp. tritici]
MSAEPTASSSHLDLSTAQVIKTPITTATGSLLSSNAYEKTSATSSTSFLGPVHEFTARISKWRDSLNLPDPGTYEQVGREAKGVHLTNYIFDGARAELAKALSLSPAFNVTHSFNMGAQGGAMGGIHPGTYSFGGMYATNNVFAQGTIDSDATLMGRFNYRWGSKDISKLQIQWPSNPTNPSVTQVEHERHGQDYALSMKAYNPNISNQSGIFITQYLQSLHPRFSLGIESVWQVMPPMEDASMSYLMKWQSAKREWISTLTLQATGPLQASYWQKLSDQVEAAVDLHFLPHPSPRERKAVSTVGLKYDFRQATVRAQADSTGKVSMLLEQRIAPMFTFSVAGELDHAKSQSKFGVGIQLESSPLDENSLKGLTPPSPPM